MEPDMRHPVSDRVFRHGFGASVREWSESNRQDTRFIFGRNSHIYPVLFRVCVIYAHQRPGLTGFSASTKLKNSRLSVMLFSVSDPFWSVLGVATQDARRRVQAVIRYHPFAFVP